MKKTEPDHYEVLGIRRDASLAAVKQAYRELVRRYHPDTAGDSPEARGQFERLQEAYEVLADPEKRAKYDETLPPRKYPAQALDAEGLWREATELLFERSDSFSSLLQTMRVAVPIALEGNMLIVGVAGKDQYLSGHLSIPGNRYRIIEALREVSGQDIDYRVIEGTTQQDWEFVQRAEGRRPGPAPEQPEPAIPTARPAGVPSAAPKTKQATRGVEAPQVTAWDLLSRKITNGWGGTPNRQHPLTRAEFLQTAIRWISDTMKEATEEGMAADAVRREVGKAIERVAQFVDIPATVVAMELTRAHPRRRSG